MTIFRASHSGTSLQPGEGMTNVTSHAVRLPSFSDPETLIRRLEYIVSSQKRIPYTQFESGEFLTTFNGATISAAPSFRDSAFVYVRAVNRVGMPSDIVVVPYKTRDLTLPDTPLFTTLISTAGLEVRFAYPTDTEAGITGFLYALGTTPGGTDIKGWGTPERPDIPATAFKLFTWSGTYRYRITISNTELPMEQEFYLTLRSVNGQHIVSLPVTSTMIYISKTPPQFTDIKVDAAMDMLTIQGLATDKSGMRRITSRIYDKITGEVLHLSTIYNGWGQIEVNINASFTITDLARRHSLGVSLIAENLPGLVRTLNTDVLINPATLSPMPAPTGVTERYISIRNQMQILWKAPATAYVSHYEVVRVEDEKEEILSRVEPQFTSTLYPVPSSGDTSRVGVRAVSVRGERSRIVFPLIQS
jgi:hypothetical protein